MDIILNSAIYRVIKINRKSKAKMFKDLHIGDEIKFSISIKEAAKWYGCSATYIEITNLINSEKASKTFSQVDNILKAFDLEEVK